MVWQQKLITTKKDEVKKRKTSVRNGEDENAEVRNDEKKARRKKLDAIKEQQKRKVGIYRVDQKNAPLYGNVVLYLQANPTTF